MNGHKMTRDCFYCEQRLYIEVQFQEAILKNEKEI